MEQAGLTGRLAVWSARRRWWVFTAWVTIVAALVVGSTAVTSTFTNQVEFTNDPDSQRAADVLVEYRGADPLVEQVVVSHPQLTVDDAEYRQFVVALVAELRQHPTAFDVTGLTSYFELRDAGSPFAEGLVSADRRTTLVPARLLGELDDSAEKVEVLKEAVAAVTAGTAFTVLNGGFASVNDDFNRGAEEDLKSEQRVLPVAFIVLVVVFGAVVAAVVPMVIAAVSIASAFMAIALVAAIWPLSTFVYNVSLMIGLAVGIDYALFIVGRFREERVSGHEQRAAIAITGDTASRAVLFSGGAVVIGLAGMFVVPNTIFKSFAVGAITVVVFTVAVALTLLPAILSLLGDNVNRLRVPFFSRQGQVDSGRGFWAAAARTVMARPWVSVIGSVGLLVALAIPYAQIELGFTGVGALPESSGARQAFEVLEREFVGGAVSPTEIVVQADDVSADAVQASVGRVVAALQAQPALFTILGEPEVSPAGDLVIIPFAVPGESASAAAFDAFEQVRDEIVPAAFEGSGATVLIGGETPLNVDFVDSLSLYTPVIFVFVLGFSFVLLLMVFRSLIVPLKAILMNLLSVGAAYGVVVAIFQLGWGADLLGFGTVEKIEAWLPLFMFTILFGLSMDYHVFLLSRVREAYDQSGDNTAAVEHGLRSTANVITGAALIMVAVFAGFALGDLVMFQQMGTGLTVAIFLDATVVRTVLVPSAMELLGDWNWYLPPWLDWVPDLRVEAEPPAPPVVATPGGEGSD
ncbi:MAG: MMPL family transporter [Dehalococcoidia bacterium]|nr:MMPL family transporter [Dehalococcoidia bacterium]